MSYERLNITDFVDKWDVAKVQHLEDAIISNEEGINHTIQSVPQILTDDEKAQARMNINAEGYDWYKLSFAGQVANIKVPYIDSQFIDWAMVDAMTGAGGMGLASEITIGVHFALQPTQPEEQIKSMLDQLIIPNMDLLVNNNIIPTKSLSFIYTNNSPLFEDCEVYSINSVDPEKVSLTINASQNRKSCVLRYNSLTQEITFTNIAPYYWLYDETLSKSGWGADAAAVGAALNEVKANQTQADWNQNDETAVDFIKNKPGTTYQEEHYRWLFHPDDEGPPTIGKQWANTESYYYITEDLANDERIHILAKFDGFNFVKEDSPETILVKLEYHDSENPYMWVSGDEDEGVVYYSDVYVIQNYDYGIKQIYFIDKTVTIPENSIPPTIARKSTISIPDLTEAPTAEDFNNLLAALRSAGYLATE